MDSLDPQKATESAWCLVGNIKETTEHGVGGAEKQPGTRHFSPGTKVYCLPCQWGDGYENIKVVGHHRGSKRYVCMVMQARWITNWRAQAVYSPAVLRQLRKHSRGLWKDQRDAEEAVVVMRTRERPGRSGPTLK